MTGLRYFFGEHPRFRHEFEQLRELAGIVEGADLPGPVYLASNFLLANGEIDCLLLMPGGIVVLDLKAYQGEVHGEEEGDLAGERARRNGGTPENEPLPSAPDPPVRPREPPAQDPRGRLSAD